MTEKIKIHSQKKLYEGYGQLYSYDLEVASLDPQKKTIDFHNREILHCTDAVVVLIYAPEIDSFVLCQEFRAGIFFNPDKDDPYMLECVAGAIDKDKTPEEIARIEVSEETGLEAGNLELIAVVYSSPGRITEKTYIYCTKVEGAPKSGIHGLASEGEELKTYIIRREDVYKMMDAMEIIDAKTLLALNWFRVKRG